LDGVFIPTTNTIDLTIKLGNCVYIYYENVVGLSKDESLCIPYPIEVLDFIVDVSFGKNFFGVRIFDHLEDVIGRGHRVPEGVNFHPREVFYTQEEFLI